MVTVKWKTRKRKVKTHLSTRKRHGTRKSGKPTEDPSTSDLTCLTQDENFNFFQDQRMHTRRNSHQCSVCQMKFYTMDRLLKHEIDHWDEASNGTTSMRTYKNEKFTTRTSFSKRNSERRAKFGAYACPDCDKRCHYISNMRAHQRTHDAVGRYACSLCNKMFHNSSNLKVHRRMHSGERPYGCDTCGARFANSSNLKVHERVHSGAKPFACGVCGATFASSANRTTHRRVHTGARPFACDACAKTFSQPCSLSAHRRLHTGEKPYTCAICNEQFTYLYTLKSHMRLHFTE